MKTLLQQLQHQAAVLPPPLQAELLNYAIYLEQKAQARHRTAVPEHTRRQRLSEALEQVAIEDAIIERAISRPAGGRFPGWRRMNTHREVTT